MRQIPSLRTSRRRARQRPQAHVRVVLGRLADRALGLSERARARVRRLRQRAAERGDEERVRLLVERERRRLAGAADDPAGGAGEAAEVLGLAAGGARRELRREAAGDEQLEAEGELVRGAGGGLVVVEQPQLVGEQVEDGRARVVGLEQARDGVARARGGVERGGPLAQRAVRVERLRAVTVSRSQRPSYSSARRWKNGSRRAPKRLRVRRAPFAIAPTRPRSGV